MNLGDIRTWARKYVLVKVSQLSDAELDKIINKAKDSVTMDLMINPKVTTFTITADKSKYSIVTDIADDYLMIRKQGIEWYNGSKWKKLDGVTRDFMEQEHRNWRSDSSADPKRYFLEADSVYIHNTPDTTLADGGTFYYVAKYSDMLSDNHFPFHAEGDQTTTIPQYDLLDDCILAYVEWKAEKLKSKNDTNAQSGMYQNYLNEIARASKIVNKRPDVFSNRSARYQGMRHTR